MAVIGKIRKNFGWAVTIIIALATLAFIFNDFSKKNSGGMPNKVATVDGMEISAAEFESTRTLTENQYKSRVADGKLTQEQLFQTRLQAYYQLASEKILNRECEAIGIVVGEEELSDMFLGTFLASEARQAFTDPTTGQYNVQAVRQVMSQYDKMEPEQQEAWNQMQKNAIAERLNTKYSNLIAKSFYMPKAMAKHVSDTYDEVVDTRYAVLPFSSIEDNQVKLTDEDYKRYYDEHKNEFRLYEEMREVEFVKFDVKPSEADLISLADSVQKVFAELEKTPASDMAGFISSSFDNNYDSNYYERTSRNITVFFPDSLIAGKGAGSMIEPRMVENNWIMGKILDEQVRPDSIKFSLIAVYNTNTGSQDIKRTPAQQKALVDSLYTAISKDTTLFASNVAKFSDDPSTKNNFGDMGWVTDGNLPQSMFEPMAACPKGGIIRYARPDSLGEYIIRVTDKTVAKQKIQVASIVIGIRPSDKTKQLYKDKADVFLAKAKDLATMKTLAQKEGLNVLSSNITEMSYQFDGTPYAREAVCWAFGIPEKVKVGDVSNTVYELQDYNQYNTTFMVIGLKGIQEKGIMPLTKLKENPNFERQVKLEKKAETLLKKADQILASSSDINAFAAKANVSVDTLANIDMSSAYFGRQGAEMRVIGTVSVAKNTGLDKKAIKGFNGIYVVQIDRIGKRPVKEDPNMICQNYKMRSQQRIQQINPIAILYRDAKVKSNFARYASK
ncbi:MAG: SurA N-terminal domain-containing protein [Bacteroidales bacterium]|nr:SurA N-terminal domain-containing protein [Bacteroidales bacterium]